jgi:SOS response associated peptidase (SRAP)
VRPSGAVVVRCLRCRHESNLSDQVLARYGLKPDAPISTFVKRLRCHKCGSQSCAMIITEPNDFVAEVHDRMPVLLKPEQFEHWLNGDMGVGELKPAPKRLFAALGCF